jgi:HPt (histidine-containing phosphotransfer) domain-containing protein
MIANAMQGNREECKDVVMDDYLGKPVGIEALTEGLQGTGAVTTQSRHRLPTDETGTDENTLASLRKLEEDMGAEFLSELIELYCDDTRALLEQLKQAATAADVFRMAGLAHSIKGSSANLRMAQMAAISSQIEKLGKSGELSGSEELLAALEREFDRVTRTLELWAADRQNIGPAGAFQDH